MHHFHYIKNELYCEEVPVAEIARAVGTPAYLYSCATLKRHFRAFDNAFDGMKHLTCFSMKSNSNLAILRLFALEGGGVDIVSGGELYRALKAGIEPAKIVFSGVGKRVEDLEYALESDILMFNVESPQEILKLDEVAKRTGKKARIAVRVNPDVDPKTHPYVSTGLKENKFGIGINDAPEQYALAAGLKNLDVSGVSCHIGSQLTQSSPFVDAISKLKDLIGMLEETGIRIRYLDLGGGLGITYDSEEPPHPLEYAGAITKELGTADLTLILEPGRVITGNAGILVTRVLYTKTAREKKFFIVDAAMNDLIRPSLYGSYHAIQPVRKSDRGTVTADMVGPICESGDFFAKEREMDAFEPGDLAAIMSAGAYGFSMSSNYNSRPRACEVMVNKDRFYTIRARETFECLIKGETIPEFLNVA
ncbi:MAG: diaminopimelate decarboxylase [Deltaproteobacteria bacterium]|nr:diaminopimelate decarboxylase [Deltaproteobacteria bacterium]MBW2118457.1 diaminopimelate decarboxylase [Deltaproteobacteria bacterium]MBW2344289.1 diaminopimelate decarboxylase [Deltaproteobacteria bacterium]